MEIVKEIGEKSESKLGKSEKIVRGVMLEKMSISNQWQAFLVKKPAAAEWKRRKGTKYFHTSCPLFSHFLTFAHICSFSFQHFS